MNTPARKMRRAGLEFTSQATLELQHRYALTTARRMLRGDNVPFEGGVRPPVVLFFQGDDGRSWLLAGARPVRYVAGSAYDGTSGVITPDALSARHAAHDMDSSSSQSDLTQAAFRASFETGGLGLPAPATTRNRPIDFGQSMPYTNPPIDDPAADPTNHDAARSARTPRQPGESFGDALVRNTLQQTGAQAFQQLLGSGSVGNALASALDAGNLISNLGSAALSGLVGQGMGALMGGLFGEVTDEDDLGTQLAARFGPQMLSSYGPMAVKSMLSSGSSSVCAMLEPVSSNATIPFALADIAGGTGGVVGINNKAVLRLGDTLVMPTLQDAGPMVEGNPTILVNGISAAGAIHTAIGLTKGAVGIPENHATNVFMGAGGGAASCGSASEAAKGSGSGGGSTGSSNGESGGECTPCERDRDDNAADLNPPSWLETILGMERHTKPGEGDDMNAEYENWSILWGAMEIGSPQEPHAGITDPWLWWIPHRVFSFDMSDYYLKHDCIFDSDRRLGDAGAILQAEADAFVTGLSSDPVQNALQVVYSSATTIAGFTFALGNSLSDL